MKEYIVEANEHEYLANGDKYDELIRCKDCKHWQDNNGGYPSEECKWRTDETPDADDFCSLAERKEENGK